MTHYETLNLPSNATPAQIKKSYKQLAQQFHPDRNFNNKEQAEEQFKKIQEAYEVLSNPEKKHQYDNIGQQHHGFDPFSFKFNFFQQFTNSTNPFFAHEGNQPNTGNETNENQKISPLLDVTVEVGISLKEFYIPNSNKKVQYQKNIVCSNCNGSSCKSTDPHAKIKCTKCAGARIYYEEFRNGPILIARVERECEACCGQGTKIKPGMECQHCQPPQGASGTRPIQTEITFEIKPEYVPGTRVIIQGKGHQHAVNKSQFGNLIMIIKDAAPENTNTLDSENVIFTRDSKSTRPYDLHTRFNINIQEYLFGFTRVISHLDMKKFIIKSDPSIQLYNNMELVVPEYGLPSAASTSTAGNLIITISIETPSIEMMKKKLGPLKLRDFQHMLTTIVADESTNIKHATNNGMPHPTLLAKMY